MNAPHLLICVEKPKDQGKRGPAPDPEWNKWFAFADALKQISKPAEGVVTPTDNVWLIPLRKNMRYASSFLSLLGTQGMAHKAYLIDGEIQECLMDA